MSDIWIGAVCDDVAVGPSGGVTSSVGFGLMTAMTVC